MTDFTAESENELMNFSLEETSKICQQLGIKPVPRDKFPFFSSREMDGYRRNQNTILNAILLLSEELGSEGLEVIHQTSGNKLQTLQKKELHEE